MHCVCDIHHVHSFGWGLKARMAIPAFNPQHFYVRDWRIRRTNLVSFIKCACAFSITTKRTQVRTVCEIIAQSCVLNSKMSSAAEQEYCPRTSLGELSHTPECGALLCKCAIDVDRMNVAETTVGFFK